MDIKRDLEFLFEIGMLRFVPRTWEQFLHEDVQNVSEHNYRVTWIALIIAKHEHVENHEKIMRMAMVHDVPESRTGDVHYISRIYTQRNEHGAIKDQLKNTQLEKEFIGLFEEYEKRESIEAKIVKDADIIDQELELQEQKYKGNKIKDVFDEKRQAILPNKLFTKTAQQLWQEIQSSNPHDWHIKGRNRFTDGDWQS
ncbi:MAG: HD domain-containing protein [bacterium]